MARIDRPTSVSIATFLIGLGTAVSFYVLLLSGLKGQNSSLHWAAMALYGFYGWLVVTVFQGRAWARNVLATLLGLQLLGITAVLSVAVAAAPVPAGTALAIAYLANASLAYCLFNKKANAWFKAQSAQKEESSTEAELKN